MRATRLGTALAIALVAGGAVLGALAPLAAPAGQGVLALHAPAAHAADTTTGLTTSPSQTTGSSGSGSGSGSDNGSLNSWFAPVDSIFSWIFAKVASLFAWLLGVAAILLDYVVYYTIVQMGGFVRSVSGVGVAWGILRDIGNIALIFGFLISGIMVILDTSQYGFGSKMLPMLLVAAVFLNFSLLIGEVIVDTGNFFAIEIYAQINNGQVPTPSSMTGGLGLSAVSNEGISNRIMGVLGLQAIYQNGVSTNGTLQGNNKLKNSAITSFMMMLLFIIASFVFFSLAFVLLARFVALVLILVASPIGFAGLAIPGLSGLAKRWWHMLVNQTITAPVLLLLLYVALAVITDVNFLASAGGVKGAGGNAPASVWDQSAGLTNFMGIVLVFVIAMALLLAVVIAAKQIGAFGANVAVKFGGRISGYNLAARTLAAVPGFAGRHTIGHAAYTGGRLWMKTPLSRVPVLGIGVKNALDKGAKASFEARPAGGSVKAFGQEIVNVGKPQKGGYQKSREDTVKAHQKHAEAIPGRAQTPLEREKLADAEKIRISARNQEHQTYLAQDQAETRYRKLRAEVETLTARRDANPERWAADSRNARLLEEAQHNLEQSRITWEQAQVEATRAKQEHAEAQKSEKAVADQVSAAVGLSQKIVQESYANSMRITPSGREAKAKIKAELRKTKSQKDSERLRKVVEDALTREEGGGGGGDNTAEGGENA